MTSFSHDLDSSVGRVPLIGEIYTPRLQFGTVLVELACHPFWRYFAAGSLRFAYPSERMFSTEDPYFKLPLSEVIPNRWLLLPDMNLFLKRRCLAQCLDISLAIYDIMTTILA
jgi:hypothetical protein